MSAIWRRDGEQWKPLAASGFPSEAALHDLVEEAPHLLPLSGDPTIAVVGREVALGSGFADLVAIEADGRVAIIEIKLRKNAEARRAVVAQILTYAAFLRGTPFREFTTRTLRDHLARRPFDNLAGAVRNADQTGEFDETAFEAAAATSLADGAFRLVLVLDEAPAELVQLVGYLESISIGITIDLITVSAYSVGDEQILVPQRVDPEHVEPVEERPTATRSATTSIATRPKPIDGPEPFEQSFESVDGGTREQLQDLVAWARGLEDAGLASLKSVLGKDRQILLVWVPGEKAGLISVWNDGSASMSLWRSVFVRFASDLIPTIEELTGSPIGQGTTIAAPSKPLLDLIRRAYEAARDNAPTWDGNTYYVAFGEGLNRNWDDARRYGFVAAGGGAWYSRSLRQLQPGNRVFAYIPKGSGVGGYVGVGTATGTARLAREFLVPHDGRTVPVTEVANADMVRVSATDPDDMEWVVPVDWTHTVDRADAIRDSDFFANQNSAVRLTHTYTISRLNTAFDLEPNTDAARRAASDERRAR